MFKNRLINFLIWNAIIAGIAWLWYLCRWAATLEHPRVFLLILVELLTAGISLAILFDEEDEWVEDEK